MKNNKNQTLFIHKPNQNS